MKPELLQQLFGIETAKVYIFDGSIPDDSNFTAYVTEEFAKAAGTNLINCIVSSVQGITVVYTQDNIQIEEGQFRLYIDLPLPEPLEVPEEVVEPQGPQ